MKHLLCAILLLVSQPLIAAESSALAGSNLLGKLQAYLDSRQIEPSDLTAEQLVALMLDWYRLARSDSATPATDTLVFRYGGWSEGCAAAFNFSVLRRVKAPIGDADQVAGITMMFEPSRGADLKPYASTTAEWKSSDDFRQAVEQSLAFKLLANTRPMAVVLESGAFR